MRDYDTEPSEFLIVRNQSHQSASVDNYTTNRSGDPIKRIHGNPLCESMTVQTVPSVAGAVFDPALGCCSTPVVEEKS